jgi:hypothetical protein
VVEYDRLRWVKCDRQSVINLIKCDRLKDYDIDDGV